MRMGFETIIDSVLFVNYLLRFFVAIAIPSLNRDRFFQKDQNLHQFAQYITKR